MKFLFPLSLLFSASLLVSAATELETKFPELGVNSLDLLDYSYDVSVDENCDYTMTVNFSHNMDFTVGSKDTCAPGVLSDYDGLPMFAGRYMYEGYPEYVEQATGFNHLSLDYNPCGHPVAGWLTPHYDLHFYMVTPEYRATTVVCDTIPGVPVCDPQAQSTDNGRLFFDLVRLEESPVEVSRQGEDEATLPPLINMPKDFQLGMGDAVINMGMHSFNHSAAPKSAESWTTPSLTIVSHRDVICWEPMLPLRFTLGDEDHMFAEDVEYVGQTITTLPASYSIGYKADDHVTTVVLKGKSNTCQADFDSAKASYEASMTTKEEEEEEDPAEDDGVVAASGLGSSLLVAFVGFAAMVV